MTPIHLPAKVSTGAAEAKHTPAPWKVDPAHPTTICHGYSTLGEAALTYGLSVAIENAALMSQAPDLLHQRDELRKVLDRLVSAVENTEVKQSTKNANASFIDTRAWLGGIVGAAMEGRAALANCQP